MENNYNKVIDFWFHEIDQSFWWKKDLSFDAKISKRFGDWHEAAKKCELSHWRKVSLGALSEIIILDQFSRNMFRGRPEAFAQDPMALALSQVAIEKGQDKEVDTAMRSFFYMPFMHSESKEIHRQAIILFQKAPANLGFEKKHQDIIERFGRYPHRNEILGRKSTQEEIDFLKQPGSSF